MLCLVKLLYCIETWTQKIFVKYLEAFKMWIPCVAWSSNYESLRSTGAQWECIQTIQCQKMSYLRLTLKNSHYQTLQRILLGKTEDRRGVRWRQTCSLDNGRECMTVTSIERLFFLATDRKALAMEITNIREIVWHLKRRRYTMLRIQLQL